MGYGLGVDLGTTYTAAAIQINGRIEVAQLGGRRPEIPSLVFVRPDGEVLVGEAAERRGAAEPGRLAREFKRRVGDPVPILVGGAPYSAHALTARLLTEVHAIVSRHQEGPPTDVTVTHPANWGPYKRELLGQAIQLADLDGVTLRSEPEAAAVQYAAGERVQPDEVIAVYDLGGGTFDAAVLRKTTTGFELLGEPEGIEQLGGIDFDEAVFGHVIATLGNHVTDLDPDDEDATAALARLRRDCVEAKEGLSFDTEVMIPVALPGLHTRVRLNRSEFEAMITPALSDTIATMRRAFRSAGIAPSELRSVLLAGGSSRIPLVGQLLSTEFGRPVVLDPHPEHTIALGAARLTAPALASVVEAPTPAPPTRPTNAPGPTSTAAAAQSGTTAPSPSNSPAPTSTPAATHSGTTAPSPSGTTVPSPATAAAAPGPAPAAPAPAPAPVGRLTEKPTVAYVAGQATVTANAESAVSPPPQTPSRPRRTPHLTRRTLLIGIPAVAALGGAGAVAASLARSADSKDSGATSAASPAQGGLADTTTMLVRVDQGGVWPASRSGVYRVNLESGQRTPLAEAGFDILPQWSRDRRKIAFSRRTGTAWQVWTMNADGTNPVLVTDRIKPSTRVSWAPDGRRLAFLGQVGKRAQLFVITIGESTPIQLTNTDDDKDDMAWSPTDDLIAIKHTRSGQQQIVVMAVQPDPTYVYITTGPAHPADPTWSLDGRRIAYTHSVKIGDPNIWTSHIWVMNADGTGNQAVTSSPDRDWDPSWSPDGSSIAFSRGTNEAPAVYVVRADGTGERRITAANAREGNPAWS